MYDFRPDVPYVVRDREVADAHWKIVSGLLAFEPEKMAALGYEDLDAGIRRARATAHSRRTLLTFARRSYRNVIDSLYSRWTNRATMKAPGDDARHGSFEGYSKAYELISYFAAPTWFGWYHGRMARTSALLHHLSNMERLARILDRWGSKEVLEFGVGSGVNLLLLRRACSLGQDIRLSGFDFPVSRLLTARSTIERFGLDVDDLFLADGLSIPLPDNSVDVVFSHYVIEQLAGFEQQALTEMLRVARTGVVLFETAVLKPTFNEAVYMSHSGYSRDLPIVVKALKGVEVEEMYNIRDDRFFGCPNVQFVIRKG